MAACGHLTALHIVCSKFNYQLNICSQLVLSKLFKTCYQHFAPCVQLQNIHAGR